MAKDKKESCPRCQGTKFSVALDASNKHYCQTKGCGNIWVPGVEVSGRGDLVLKRALKENIELKAEINSIRDTNSALKAEVQALKDKYEPEEKKPEGEAEIFS